MRFTKKNELAYARMGGSVKLLHSESMCAPIHEHTGRNLLVIFYLDTTGDAPMT